MCTPAMAANAGRRASCGGIVWPDGSSQPRTRGASEAALGAITRATLQALSLKFEYGAARKLTG